jgi:two-component system, LytTR family, response regulator
MIKILIVDDEEEVRDLLKILLRNYPDSEIVGEASNVDEAVRHTFHHQPDMVLLDIQMPQKDGFTYLSEIRERSLHPGIIFVTAFENFAIKAIRSAAFDYLLKPINKVELFNALDRYKQKIAEHRSSDISELLEHLNRSKHARLRLNTRSGYFFVDPEEIAYCEADGNYSYIWLTNGKKEITTMSLGNIEKYIENESFIRISRSYIVNMNYVSRVDRRANICELEVTDTLFQLKIPSQNIKMLEGYFD